MKTGLIILFTFALFAIVYANSTKKSIAYPEVIEDLFEQMDDAQRARVMSKLKAFQQNQRVTCDELFCNDPDCGK